MRLHARTRVAVAATLLTLSLACTKDAAPESDSPPGDGGLDATSEDAAADAADAGCALIGRYGSLECEDCLRTTCCGPITACDTDPDCAPLRACVLDCLSGPDPKVCYAECRASHVAGQALWDDVFSCWLDPPPDTCGIECTYETGRR